MCKDKLNFSIPTEWIDVGVYRRALLLVQQEDKCILKVNPPRRQGQGQVPAVYYVLSQSQQHYKELSHDLVERCSWPRPRNCLA